MEPATVLLACGLPVLFDEAFYMSPMRKNLSLKSMLLNDGTSSAISHRLIMQNSVAAIKQHAPHQRVLIFVMFKWELELVATWLRKGFPGSCSCGCLPHSTLDTFSGRTVLTYSREERSDLSGISVDTIVVATSALQTGDRKCSKLTETCSRCRRSKSALCLSRHHVRRCILARSLAASCRPWCEAA
jgi:hypothetical protein